MWSTGSVSSSPYYTEANRPVRQRKTVTHYSDDNPQTFTVKKKRGSDVPQQQQQQQGDQENDQTEEEEDQPIHRNDDYHITSTGRIIKRTSMDTTAATNPSRHGRETSLQASSGSSSGGGGGSKKRRAAMSHPSTNHSHPNTPTTTTSTTTEDRDVNRSTANHQHQHHNHNTTNTTTRPSNIEYGINPRTGKVDKRFRKKIPHEHDNHNSNNNKYQNTSTSNTNDNHTTNNNIMNKDDASVLPPVQDKTNTNVSSVSLSPNQSWRKRRASNTTITTTVTNRSFTQPSRPLHKPVTTTTTTTTTAATATASSKRPNTTTIPSLSSSSSTIPSSLDMKKLNPNAALSSSLPSSTSSSSSPDTFSNETFCISHTAALQPILPLPIILPPISGSSTKTSVSSLPQTSQPSESDTTSTVRISTTSALWSDRVVPPPPTGMTSHNKGPSWKLTPLSSTTTTTLKTIPNPYATTSTTTSTSTQSTTTSSTTTLLSSTSSSSSSLAFTQPPPPITWFALREDNPSYAITGNVYGALALYHLSAAAPELLPLSVVECTSAALREQQSEHETRRPPPPSHLDSNKPVAKRTYVSYPNAIVQCHWYQQLLIVLTADEMEILRLPNTASNIPNPESTTPCSSSGGGVQLIAHWSLTILNDPSVSLPNSNSNSKNNNNSISTASMYMWKRFNNSNRTTQSPCFSVQSVPDTETTLITDDNNKNNNNSNENDNDSNHRPKKNDRYRIFWTTRSTDTFNPTLVQIDMIPNIGTSHDGTSENQNEAMITTTMKSICLPVPVKDGATTTNTNTSSSLLSTDTSRSHWRCWTTLCEQSYPTQDSTRIGPSRTGRHTSILMIAQTGPETIELLRCCDLHHGTTTITTTTTTNNVVPTHPDLHPTEQQPLSSPSTFIWQEKTIEVVLRQSLPYVTTTRGSYHHLQNSNSSNSTNENHQVNGRNNNYPFLPIPDCCIQQYTQFTFVTGTGSRGIRMYRTETLEAVATFGENVQVHGKVAVWSRCAWIKAGTLQDANIQVDISSCNTGPNSNNATTVATFGNMAVSSDNATSISAIVSAVSKKKLPWWIERNDELAIRQREKDRLQQMSRSKGILDEDEYWLIGIPHPYRGPSELKTTLYLWKPGVFAATENEATTTLQLPSGGCFGDYYISSHCHRMVCVGADSSQLHVWDSALRTDFAGIMYPVGYKVITDNLEYIEDEDELDEIMESSMGEKQSCDTDDNSIVNESKTLDALVDSDLAEAMRLSLLELQRQQSNELGEEKISVLCESTDRDSHSMDNFVIPPWPDQSYVNKNAPNSPGSPQQRHRALSHCSFVDSNNTFEHSFLNVVPYATMVRDEVKLMTMKKIQRKEAADNGLSILDKPKPKSKKARSANIEILLQSSIDGNLRRRMDDIRTIWKDGTNNKTIISIWDGIEDTMTDTNVSSSSLPAETTNDITQIHKNDSLASVASAATKEAVLTEDLRQTISKEVEQSHAACAPENEEIIESTTKSVQCSACTGRFVLHSCGLREKPIDYDEIARLEQAEREREEEEKQKERVLKRRQAEAKRKESRRKKKEDMEQKKIEDFEQTNVNHQGVINVTGEWEEQRSLQDDYYQSSNQNYEQNIHYRDHEHIYDQSETRNTVESCNMIDSNYNRYNNAEIHTSEYSSSGRQWGRTEQDPDGGRSNQGSIQINGTEVTPSMSLHPMDALEALAGLAGSIAKPVPLKETAHNFNVIHTSKDDDRYDESNRLNGFSNHGSDEGMTTNSSGYEKYDPPNVFVSDSAVVKETEQLNESHAHVASIAHVDYRDGRGGLTQLETTIPVQQGASILTPPLHKPMIDPSLDQAMLLADMAETAVAHGTHQYQSSFQKNESMDRFIESTSERSFRPELEQSPEAEALLALAFSASPKVIERPTVQWSSSNEHPQTMTTATDHTIYSYSPSSHRSCFGSTTSSTHAIVVSQFLQQPMAANLTNATYATINNYTNPSNDNGSGTSDVNHIVNYVSAPNVCDASDEKMDIVTTDLSA